MHPCRPLYNIKLDAQDIVDRTAREMGRSPLDARVEEEKPRRTRSSPHVASPTWEQKPATEVRKHRAPPHQRFSMSLRWMIKKKKHADLKLKGGDGVDRSGRAGRRQGESKSPAQKQTLQQRRRQPQPRKQQPRRAAASPDMPGGDASSVPVPQQDPPGLVTLQPAPSGSTVGMATVAKMKARLGERAFVAKIDAEITRERKDSVERLRGRQDNDTREEGQRGAVDEQAPASASSPASGAAAAPETPEDSEPAWANLSSELASLQAELRGL